MKKIIVLLCMALSAITISSAQTKPVPATQPFGKVDKADLELKTCDFEKDANAMVLFNKADVYFDNEFNIVTDHHKRIKIFNDNGKKEANIRIEYRGGDRSEYIAGIQAETINLTDGKIEITKVDKKLIVTEVVDKVENALVFTFPNVKPGSIIEYKYTDNVTSWYNFPDWEFQEKIPTKYSELDTEIPDFLYYRTQSQVTVPYVKNVHSSESKSLGGGQDAFLYSVEKEEKGIANIHSLPDEPYMTSDADNLQRILYSLSSIRPVGQFAKSAPDTWAKVGGALADDDDFGGQLKRKLANEDVIVSKAKALKNNEDKIAFVFNEVKNSLKWNEVDRWYTNDGTVKAWDKKAGNSAEVNLILYHLLKQSGVEAYPMLVSTRSHGKVNPYYPFLYQFNRTVVYVPIDTAHFYVIDATNKYNTYRDIPSSLLNSTGLYLDKAGKRYDLVFLQRKEAVRQAILINAEIKPEGKIEGIANLSSYGYPRISAVKKYKTDGEDKYKEQLNGGDNSLKITSVKMENMDVDTLPLMQTAAFKLELTGSDGNFIYFSPNQFSPLHNNPFLSESRFTDVDFGYRNYYSINGVYKMPAGFKTESMPKSMSIVMPDQSITFRRIVAEQDGNIVVHYTIDFKKSIYFKEDYPDFHAFYKKMQELLDEQIVLKKS